MRKITDEPSQDACPDVCSLTPVLTPDFYLGTTSNPPLIAPHHFHFRPPSESTSNAIELPDVLSWTSCPVYAAASAEMPRGRVEPVDGCAGLHHACIATSHLERCRCYISDIWITKQKKESVERKLLFLCVRFLD